MNAKQVDQLNVGTRPIFLGSFHFASVQVISFFVCDFRSSSLSDRNQLVEREEVFHATKYVMDLDFYLCLQSLYR